ncbi:MAG: hypothetical protein H0T85_00425 [Geodermatophilaceae bacterium]|nr:hypothetical protein [Geodermatophilaceae bacterium]
MWLFLSHRLRTWLLLTVAAPMVAKVLQGAGNAIERRRGPSTLTRGLCKAGTLLDRRRRNRSRG